MVSTIALAERGLLPEALERWGIRRLLRERLLRVGAASGKDRATAMRAWAGEMRKAPIALVPQTANEQHYEVPPEFFEAVLGPHRKYSSCYFTSGVVDLGDAERRMLELTCARAQIRNGQRILELGCGWGSLSLWMARKFPESRITAVSNSTPQREFIEKLAREEGLGNLEVLTRDMNEFEATGPFDRIVSVEMFEHMRNWEELFRRLDPCLAPAGRVFIHVFSHRVHCYPFEDAGREDWLARHFFTGGMMPSHDLLQWLELPFEIEKSWPMNGSHYARTADAWLGNLESRREEVMPILASTYGIDQASRWFHRWRLFFLSCSELFSYQNGDQWQVSHFLLKRGFEGRS